MSRSFRKTPGQKHRSSRVFGAVKKYSNRKVRYASFDEGLEGMRYKRSPFVECFRWQDHASCRIRSTWFGRRSYQAIKQHFEEWANPPIQRYGFWAMIPPVEERPAMVERLIRNVYAK